MIRLGRREVAEIVLTIPDHPILRVDTEQLVEPEIAEIIIPAAVTVALAGERGSIQRSIEYLSGVNGVIMDADTFAILCKSDIHPLVAIALAHYQLSRSDHLGSIDFGIDAALGGNDAGIYLMDDLSPGPILDLNYGLGGGWTWMAWQRIVRFEDQIELPEVLEIAITGQPLSRLLSHPALDPMGFVIESINGEDVHVTGTHDWTKLADLPALYSDLARRGGCQKPAPSDFGKSGVMYDLAAMTRRARERADRLEAAVARITTFE